MSDLFTPYINTINFENKILKLLENEGGNTLVINTIQAKIQNQNIYKSFILLCHEYHIYYQAFNLETLYQICIIINGYQSLFLKYKDKNKDISIELASILFSELSIQIRNRNFLDKIKE
ncbi:hypothetical protein [uncultured Chryseobacterium sp.]|uniref:hypothetical protein n=1 Tax=uncultured Chryseobacterium sp. TaxID=259322 RepID=UPI0025EE9DA1|nr:hypothetical protein [uncultured Chryseobacterium sp.]